MVKSTVVLCAIVSSLFLVCGFAKAAPQPVTAITAHFESTSGSGGDYRDSAGNRITFNRGNDNLLFVDSATVNGNRLISGQRADRVNIKRVTSNNCAVSPDCHTNIGGISGEKHFFQYPYIGSPFNHDLAPPRAYSYEQLYLDGAINISADNPLSNLDNNIERIDIVYSQGVLSPTTPGARKHTGFVIPERWGNNPHIIAAIASIDAQGNPTSFYPLSKGNISDYGNTQFTIIHADGSVSGPAPYSPASHRYKNQDQPVSGGIAGSQTRPLNGQPDYFLSTLQPIRATFHSFDQLGVPAGDRIYGFSAFGIDVSDDMDLVGLSDVPLNTDRIIADSADIFGSIGMLFVPGPQANIGLAKAVIETREIEAGVFEVDFAFVVENLSNEQEARNVQVTDDLALTFAGVPSFEVLGTPDIGRFTPPAVPFNGKDQIKLLSGRDTLGKGEKETIRLTVRVDIGTSSGVYLNSAQVTTAFQPDGEPSAADLSDEGSEPDSDGDGFANGPGEDDPTAILLGPEAGLITVDKSAGKQQVAIGDAVAYSLTIRNNTSQMLQGVEIQDTPPRGFNYIEGSAVLVRRGNDGRFGTADDISQTIEPRGDSTLIFGPFDMAAQELARINYLLRVGAGVVPGEHQNVALPYLSDDPAGNSDVVGVEVIKDSALQQGTIIGVVFHDRDRDGYQDAAHASRVQIKMHGVEEFLDTSASRFLVHEDQKISGNFSQGFTVSTIEARAHETRSSELRQVQLMVPLKADVNATDLASGQVTVESAEGTWLEGSLLGYNRRLEKSGKVAIGVNSQRLSYYSKIQTTERGNVLVLTIVNDAIDEAGIPGVRLATVQGLLIETDAYGRYHLAEIDIENRVRGGNFIVKLDQATLPEGAWLTTENPRVLRISNSVLNRINFGVHLPEQKIPVTEFERKVPARTEIQDQLHIDYSTHFIDKEIGPVRFKSGESALDQTDLDQLAPAIEELKGKENIELRAIGHTDPVPLGDRLQQIYGDNQGLSEARAKVVADHIKGDDRFDEIDVTTEGRAYSEPVATNATAQGRARNRRVEVQIVYDKSVEQWVKVPVQVPERTVVEQRPLIDGGTLWVTEDPSINDPRLTVSVNQSALLDQKGYLDDLLSFTVYTNYELFIKRWELQLYNPKDISLSQPAITINGEKLRSGMRIDIGDLQELGELHSGDVIPYKFKVYDEQGRWDETRARSIRLTKNSSDASLDVFRPEREINQKNDLSIQSIPIRGSRVRVYGAAVSQNYTLALDGQELRADGKGAFVTEQHLPIGQHQLQLDYKDEQGHSWTRDVSVEVRGDYLFMVGLANLTLGNNDFSGVLESLEEDDEFDEDTFVNARGAFYLKGKIKGKYLITAQLDTREEEFRNLDEQLKRKDRTTLFRNLDPDRYYPVYGDDSTVYSDVDTQGAYYVRLDWDKSRALWGNFNTDITANEFAQYNRTLYGAQLVYRMPELTQYGNYKNSLSAFVSEAQSASAHNEFQATGGSLYYLQQTDIIVGSEKIWIEIREKNTSQIVERYPLRNGLDYEIDYFQGRIILSRPLSQIARSVVPSIIQDEPLQGDSVFMLVDYEYVPEDFSFDNVIGGIRGKTWLGDSIGLGVTAIDEERDAEDYSLQGADLTWQFARGSYITGEYARSEASQSSSGFVSADGGLTFDAAPFLSGPEREGEALGAEVRLDFAEMTEGEQSGELRAWHKDREAGFSSSRDDNGQETKDKGIYGRWQATEALLLSLRTKQLETDDDSRISHSVQIDGDITDRLKAGLEIQKTENTLAGISQKATLAGTKLTYRLRQQTSIYGKAQSAVSSNQAYEDNDQYALGFNTRRSDRLTLGGEVVTGDRGDGLILGADYRFTEKAGVSISAGFGDNADSLIAADYTLDNGLNLYGSFAKTTADSNEEKTTYTLGQRKVFGNRLAVYAENQLSDTDQQAGLTHVFGVDYDVDDYLGLSFSLQNSTLTQDEGSDITRRTASVGVQYRKERARLSTRLEYRRDRSDLNSTQWLSSNAIEWKQTRDYRWLGRLNYSITRNDDTNTDEARFTEAGIGFAYRPALNDRFNLLTRLTYIEDLPSLGQDTTAVDERAWVLATEGAYAVTPRWELGGKLAGKRGEIRQQRNAGEWFDANTRFYATRVRYHWIRQWDGLAEYRWLETVEDKTVRSGALLALYRHVGEHVKAGIGFNFTDFNDDLTRLDYDNRGWFLDIVAKY